MSVTGVCCMCRELRVGRSCVTGCMLLQELRQVASIVQRLLLPSAVYSADKPLAPPLRDALLRSIPLVSQLLSGPSEHPAPLHPTGQPALSGRRLRHALTPLHPTGSVSCSVGRSEHPAPLHPTGQSGHLSGPSERPDIRCHPTGQSAHQLGPSERPAPLHPTGRWSAL